MSKVFLGYADFLSDFSAKCGVNMLYRTESAAFLPCDRYCLSAGREAPALRVCAAFVALRWGMLLGGTRGPALRVCAAIMPLCYVIRLCLISTLFNIQRFRAKRATDLHHTKKLRTPHKKCRVFRYPTLIFVVIFVPLPEFMSLFSYTPLILCR